MSITNALKWSFLSELASKAVAPLVFIVLASLLTPEDFGVMTAALMVIGFSQIFWEAGMGKALIQRQIDVDDAANVAFWINIGLGILISSLLFFTAESIAQTFFHDDRVCNVIKVMTLQIFLGAASSVHSALLQKSMAFKKLFWVRFSTVALPGLASVPLALNGMGYWSLVVGALIGQLSQTILLWHMNSWAPRLKLVEINLFHEMLKYGSAAFSTAITGWFYNWADSLAIGYFMSVHDMGLYKLAANIVNIGNTLIFGSMSSVLFSHLSNTGLTEFKKYKERLVWLALTTGVILYFISPFLEKYALSVQWAGIGFLISTLALVNLVGNIWAGNSEGYAAKGNPGTDAKIYIFGMLYYIPAYFYLGPLGVDNFAIGRLILVFIAAPIHIYYSTQLLNYTINDYTIALAKAFIPITLLSAILYSLQSFLK